MPTTPLDFTFTKVATIPYTTLLPSALQLFAEPFVADTGQFTKFSENTPAAFSVSGGVCTIANTSGAARNDIIVEGADLAMPQVFVQIDVVTRSGTPTGFDNIGVGIAKDANNFVWAAVDRVAGNVRVQVKIGGTNTFNAIVSRALGNGPYTLGFSLVANSACVYVNTGSGWEFVTGYQIPTSTINFGTASLTGWKPGFTVATSGSGNSSWTFDNFAAGRFGGVGIRDINIVTEENGTPHLNAGAVYATATCPDARGIGYLAVFSIDLTTYALTQTAAIMISRGGATWNDLAAHIIWYANGDRRLLVSSWGNGFGGAIDIWHGLISGSEILVGSWVLGGLSKLTLPDQLSGYAAYDPCLVKDGTTWRLAHSLSINTTFVGRPFYAAASTSTDLVTWTADGSDPSHTGYEGTRVARMSADVFILAGGLTDMRCYDKHCAFLGTLSAEVDGDGVTQPHPMFFLNPLTSRWTLISFDGIKAFTGATADFTWGRMIVEEALTPPTTFTNDPEVDLVWVEITDRTGTVHVISESDLPDRQAYYHGLKLGLLTEFGEIDRRLSDRYGEHEVPSFTFSFFDEHGTWRALAADASTRDFAGMTIVYRGITDAGRRAEETPRVLFRGVVREHHWKSDYELQFVCEDPLSKELAVNNDQAQLPKASVNIDDFAGCATTKVPSSAENYVVNGAQSTGATKIAVRSGVGQFAAGDIVSFGAGTDTYTVSRSSKTNATLGQLLATETAETEIEISPGLVSGIADGAAVVQTAAHTVAAAVGTSVPFVYGLISDTKVAGTAVALPAVDPLLPAPTIVGQIGVSGDLRDALNPSGRRWSKIYGYKASTNKISPASNEGSNIARDDDYSNPSGVGVNFNGNATFDSYIIVVADAPDFDPVAGSPGSAHHVVYITHDNVTHDGVVPGADFQAQLHAWTGAGITDLLGGTSAVGKGQGPMKFIGDETLDGRRTALFLWSGHECYAPGGSPFISLNFWDTVVDVAGQGASGGRIAAPGNVRWGELGFTGTFITRNGRDYTIVGLQGIFRDWALGLTAAPPNQQGIPFAVNAYGWKDGAGNLLTSGPQIYKHAWKNYIKGDYRGGTPLAAPTFPDDPTLSMLDDASFDKVETQQTARIGRPYRLDFIIGANNERISYGETIKRLDLANDCDSCFNSDTQFAIEQVEDDPTIAESDAETLDDVQDILDESGNALEIDDQDLNLANAFRFSHTPDYLGREPSGWRSALTGFNEVFHSGSVAVHGKVYAQPVELHCVRGRNVATDVADYQAGTDTAANIFAHRLRRTAEAPRIYSVPTGMRGFNSPFELGSTMYISALKNVGGRTPRLVRIQGVRGRAGSDPQGRVVVFEAEDQTRLLTDALSISFALGVVTGSAPTSSPATTTAGSPSTVVSTPQATGDVEGQSSSTDNGIARFDGTSGKLIQNSTAIVQDDGRISNVTDPTLAQDVATKNYVDAATSGGVPAGYWSELTNGDPTTPELIFDSFGNTIDLFVPV